MVKSWSGLVSEQCSTSKSTFLVERRQSERSKDNTCDLGSTLEQLDPKVTAAGLATFLTEPLFELVEFERFEGFERLLPLVASWGSKGVVCPGLSSLMFGLVTFRTFEPFELFEPLKIQLCQ